MNDECAKNVLHRVRTLVYLKIGDMMKTGEFKKVMWYSNVTLGTTLGSGDLVSISICVVMAKLESH